MKEHFNDFWPLYVTIIVTVIFFITVGIPMFIESYNKNEEYKKYKEIQKITCVKKWNGFLAQEVVSKGRGSYYEFFCYTKEYGRLPLNAL